MRVVVPYPAGGATDAVARLIAAKLQDKLGQGFYIENVAGASGNVGMQAVARSTPDGYTISVTAANNLVTNQFVTANMSFDPVQAFAPVAMLCNAHNALVVSPTVPAASVKDFVGWAKDRSGLTYGSPAYGSQGHLGVESFKRLTNLKLELVPYRGVPQALLDMLRGDLTLMLGHELAAKPLVDDGKIRILGVASLRRSPGFPDVPTVAEQGFPGFEAMSWFSMVAPAGTPEPIVRRLNTEVNAILAMDSIRTAMLAQGVEPTGGSVEEFASRIQAEVAKWGALIREIGLTPQ